MGNFRGGDDFWRWMRTRKEKKDKRGEKLKSSKEMEKITRGKLKEKRILISDPEYDFLEWMENEREFLF